jgi:prophage regulatory protein
MSNQPVSRLVRLKEVTKRLGVCPATVYNMIQRGEFPKPGKHGRSSVWSEEDVSAKIAEILGGSQAPQQ